MTAGGLAILVLRHEFVVALYLLAYLGVLCVTPFPGQYLRYLMPLAPVLALLAVLILDSMSLDTRTVAAWMLPVLLAQGALMIAVFAREHNPVSYVDASGNRIAYELFFYDEGNREFDEVVDYLHQHAAQSEIIGAGTPQWIYLRTGLKAVMPPSSPTRAGNATCWRRCRFEYWSSAGHRCHRTVPSLPMLRAYRSEWTHLYPHLAVTGTCTVGAPPARLQRCPRPDPLPVSLGYRKEAFLDERLEPFEPPGRRRIKVSPGLRASAAAYTSYLRGRRPPVASRANGVLHLLPKRTHKRIVQQHSGHVSHSSTGNMMPLDEWLHVPRHEDHRRL